jgi:hypothetical protein
MGFNHPNTYNTPIYQYNPIQPNIQPNHIKVGNIEYFDRQNQNQGNYNIDRQSYHNKHKSVAIL